MTLLGRILGPAQLNAPDTVSGEDGRRLESSPGLDPESLEDISAPYRTERQIARLSRRGPVEGFEFAVLGDVEPGRFWFSRKLFNIPGVFERQLRRLQEHPIDFTVQLGDMVSRGVRRNYARFFRQLAAVGPSQPYLTVIGNHDRQSPHRRSNSDLYRACFGRNDYFFDHGGVRFVVVDTSARALSLPQLTWLSLALHTRKRKVVFTHVPPATLCGWTDFAGARGLGGFRRGAEEFTEIMSARAVDRVYLGHIHGFGVQDKSGVRYVLTGGGGSPLFPSEVSDRYHHYLVVRVVPDGFSETVVDLDGRRFTVPCGKVLLSR